MQRSLCLICFTNLFGILLVDSARPTYDFSREDSPTFRGTNAFGKSTKAVLANKTFQGASFLTRADNCQEEKTTMQDIFQNLGLQTPQGSYCTWPGVQCQGCNVTEVQLTTQQRQEASGQLSLPLGHLTHLQLLDLGGITQLSGDLELLRNATELRELNLSQSQVQGNLRALEDVTHLRVLDLEGTLVEGSLEVFRNTLQLEILSLSSTRGKVIGDLDVFEQTEKLKIVRLNATAVTGKIWVFPDVTKDLEELQLENAVSVSGEVEDVMRELSRLQKIMVTNAKIRGAVVLDDVPKDMREMHFEHAGDVTFHIESLCHPTLRRVIAKGVEVQGETSALVMEDLPRNLSELQLEPLKLDDPQDFWYMQLFGDMKFLRKLPQLEVLSLKGSDISGDVKVLRHLPKLRSINLAKTKVRGSIKALKGLKQVEVLDFAATNVSGDIKAFANANKLQHLCLSDTAVQGNISVFHNKFELRKLLIQHSKVVGDLQVLQSTQRLEVLWAWATNILGDIRVFSHMPELRRVGLSMTAIHGDLEALAKTPKLQGFGFSSTKVLGDIGALAVAQELDEIFLSETQTSGDIRVLSRMKKLKALDLASTQVHGDVQAFATSRDLKSVLLDNTMVHGALESFQAASKLQVLTLKDTQISGHVDIFANMTKLRNLQLEGCNVSGNISSFRRAENLHVLSLSSTLVFGTLRSLSHMKKLRQLELAATRITGKLIDLISMPDLEITDLSRTHVSGKVSAAFDGHCKALRSLDLTDSNVRLLPSKDVLHNILLNGMDIFPALTNLEVSGCDLNGPLLNLFQLLSGSRTSTLYASNCGLTGNLSDLSAMRRWDDTGSFLTFGLAASLLDLDISGNSLEAVEALPSHAMTALRDNHGELHFAKGVLAKALKSHLELDLRNTKLVDASEARKLLETGMLNMTPGFTWTNDTGGYGCYGLDQLTTNLHIGNGKSFLPDKMCICLKGWYGHGINCTKCANDTYSNRSNASMCTPCPNESHTEAIGATSVSDCKCKVGGLIRNRTACGCSKSEALHKDTCRNCMELNLDCPTEGLTASNAPSLDGFARLEEGANQSYKCFEPSGHCNHSGLALQNCARGYEGYLCMDCSPDYFASSGQCWLCDKSHRAEAWRWWIAVSLGAAVVVGLMVAWCFYDMVMGAFQVLSGLELTAELKQQGPLLLQNCQLWAVLSTLSVSQQGGEGVDGFRGLANWEVELPELPYIRGMRFSPVDLQGSFNFQCVMNGADARYWMALVAPMMPLILLLFCGVLEKFCQGSGIGKGLLVLSIFFVGGASSCKKLVSCKSYDAGGRKLGEFAFQESMPSFKCSDLAPEVNGVFYVTAMCYLIVIPGFLLYLFAKQHSVLRSNKLLVSCSRPDRVKELCFKQIPLKKEVQLEEVKEEMLERRLVAGAVAYAAVFLEEKAMISVSKSTVTVKDSTEETSEALKLQSSGSIDENESFWSGVVELKDQSDAFRCRAITEMLMERCVLFERCELPDADDRERVLSGARDMLMKYAVCQNVWMEILLKLVTISLVSVVQNPHDGLKMSLAVTLVMAALVALMRPYAQAQVNNLQCSCFISLAVAAVSFSFRVPWLSRVSLALPFLVALAQAGLPESAEARASKIWQELERKLKDPSRVKGQPITVSTKTLTVSITIHERGPK